MNLNNLRSKYGAGDGGNGVNLTPASVEGWRKFASAQEFYLLRVNGLGVRGLRFAVAAVLSNGLIIVAPNGEEEQVGFGDVTVAPHASPAKLTANPFDSKRAK